MHPSDENHMKDDLESDGTYRVAPDDAKRDAQELRRVREVKPARAATTRALETRQALTQDDETEGDLVR